MKLTFKVNELTTVCIGIFSSYLEMDIQLVNYDFENDDFSNKSLCGNYLRKMLNSEYSFIKVSSNDNSKYQYIQFKENYIDVQSDISSVNFDRLFNESKNNDSLKIIRIKMSENEVGNIFSDDDRRSDLKIYSSFSDIDFEFKFNQN